MLGHKKQWQFLKKAAEKGKISHALLFYGPEQTGKRTLAIEFAKFLNCQGAKKPCGSCKSCQDIEKGTWPDLALVCLKEGKGEIQISQIRELAWTMSLKPHSSDFKIAIVDQAHLMNQEAQNCFLKLLEEPRGNAVLILVTEHPDTLFSTILSRVQKIKFFPVGNEEIEKALVEKGLSAEKAKIFTAFSFGKPGLANSFFEEPARIEKQKEIVSDLIKISQADLSTRFSYAKRMIDEKSEDSGKSLKKVLQIWLRYFRKVFLLKLAGDSKEKFFNHYSLAKIMEIIRSIQSTESILSTTNANPRLALEILLMEI